MKDPRQGPAVSAAESCASPFVSIIIPVYNGIATLEACLQRLEQQTYPGDRYEVLVVDNGENGGIERVVPAFPHARLLHEPVASSYLARNRGIAEARGEVIGFTDADCLPSPDWIQAGVRRILGMSCSAVIAGCIEVRFRNPDRPNWVELYERVKGFEQAFGVAHNCAMTANIFTPRSILDRVGPFSTRLKSSGDFEWSIRVAEAGYAIVYGEEVCVTHPARGTLVKLISRRRRISGGQYDRWRSTGTMPTIRYIRILLQGVFPVGDIWEFMQDSRLSSPLGVLKVSVLHVLLGYVNLFETLRLFLGGQSRRA
jgi:glycosyltransferase involved in cell wall biosynthesis